MIQNTNTKTHEPISWYRVVIFFSIATIISNIFRFDVFEITPYLEQLPTWLFIFISVLLEGSGVLIGGIITLFLLKNKRVTEISFFGTSKQKSLIMAAIPIMLLTIIGVNNDFELNSHQYGVIAILGTLVYCIMEELGWRGYLQEELKSLNPWRKYIIIGSIWYLWHLSFLKNASIGDNLFFLTMMIFGSWGIGQVAESTKSILACACFHMIIQILMFNALIKNGIDGTEKLIIIGISGVLYFVIIKKWEKESAIEHSR